MAAKSECLLPAGSLQRSNSGPFEGPFQFVHTFTKENPGSIEEYYQLNEVLGKGAYGSAHRAICRLTGVERAVKCILMSKVKDLSRLEVETSIAKQLDHPNIVRLYETFRDDQHLYLVMELCTGGELFERIMQDAPEGFDEGQAATYTRQILAALCYLHANGYAHRDVKPENFLLQSRSKDAALKVIDFGLASQYKRGCPMKTKVGTPYYVAPEVLQGCYDTKCDVWSAGVLCYILLCGYPPFHGDSDKDVLRRVRRGTFSFPSPDWDHISQSAKQLIQQLLTHDPFLRPSAATALKSPWLRYRARQDVPAASLGSDFIEKLQEFTAQPRMKRVALTAVAQQLKDEEISELQSTFRSLDRDGDGMLSPGDIREGLAKAGMGMTPALEELLQSVDSDGSGFLDYTEFIAATVDQELYAQRDVCLAAFRTFDLDGDGKISECELEHVLGGGDAEKSPSKRRIQRMVSEASPNGAGYIDFEDFHTMMKTISPTKRSPSKSTPSKSPTKSAPATPILSSPWDDSYLENLDIRAALFVER